MPNPLSIDLRQRAVRAYLRGEGSRKEIADRFMISTRSLNRYLKLFNEQGSLKPQPHSGGRSHQKLFEVHLEAIDLYRNDRNTLTHAQIAARLHKDFGLTIDPSQVSRATHHRQPHKK